MKTQFKYTIYSLVLILLLSTGLEAAVKTKNKTISIQTSAVCAQCKKRIETALKTTEGVEDATLNIATEKVKVKYNPDKLSENQIRLVITNTGYDADDMKKDETAFSKLPQCCQK